MRWNSIILLLIVIIIIISGVVIIIILRIPPLPGPDPICPQCGMLKWLGIAQITLGLLSLYAIPKLREEIRNDLKINK